MRSARALRLAHTSSRIAHRIPRGPRSSGATRNDYSSACGPDSPANALGESKNRHEPTTAAAPPNHRQLGIEQELFTSSPYSPGSTIFLPNGARIFNKLTDFLRKQYEHFGFEEVITPTIYKKSLWERSGHWENYAEDMYRVTGRGASGGEENAQAGEDEEYGLKPMNCPGHCIIFASAQRSYRDLPLRYADFSPLHRNEISGALSGLTRVRRFHQDDGHIFCRPSQIREEITKSLEFVKLVYGVLGLGPYRLALSTRPEDNFIGSKEEWDNAEAALRESLDASGQPWTLNEGDGAFYGPKIDIILKDSNDKEHQTATIQLDFQLPKRFELKYQAPAPHLEQKGSSTDDPGLLAVEGPVTPVMIHRAVLGSVERTMALLIEHYNGLWPFWLNPRQVRILTVNDTPELIKYAQEVRDNLQGYNTSKAKAVRSLGAGLVRGGPRISIDIDSSARHLKKKIAEAKSKRYGIIIVVGSQDVTNEQIAVDFSGIPKYRFDIRRSKMLKRLSNAREATNKKRDAQFMEWGNTFPKARSISLELPSDDDDKGPFIHEEDDGKFRLKESEVKAFRMTARLLRRVLRGFEDMYV